MQAIEPQKEHLWLKQLLGEWTFDSECFMGPDQPPSKFTGTNSNRALGDVWILCEGQGEMPGGGCGKTIMSLGFDHVKKRFVGTFIGSMMTNLWIYDGELDAAQKVLSLNAVGPSFTDPTKMVDYIDAIEVKGPDHHVLTSQLKGDDGKWTCFMTAHYRRKK